MQELSDDILQKIAKEMNLSETAFITEKNKHDTYSKGTSSSQDIIIDDIYVLQLNCH